MHYYMHCVHAHRWCWGAYGWGGLLQCIAVTIGLTCSSSIEYCYAAILYTSTCCAMQVQMMGTAGMCTGTLLTHSPVSCSVHVLPLGSGLLDALQHAIVCFNDRPPPRSTGGPCALLLVRRQAREQLRLRVSCNSRKCVEAQMRPHDVCCTCGGGSMTYQTGLAC
jgi:hypothetical protein